MCFSAEVDLLAGLVIGAVGIDALRHVSHRDERPLAAIPVVLASHQVIEAFVWWNLDGRVSNALGRPALWLYLLIAFGVLPVLVPVAVASLEPKWHRPAITLFAAVGAAVAAMLMFAVLRGPAEASIEGRHIAYRVDLWQGDIVGAMYVIATCGSLLASERRPVRWFGAANLVAAAALTWLSEDGFISLWCLWAAATSVVIAAHLRVLSHAPEPTITASGS